MKEQDPKVTAAACRYLLVALLPRLERLQPGIISEMRQGIAADVEAMRAAGKLSPGVNAVTAAALRMLDVAGSR